MFVLTLTKGKTILASVVVDELLHIPDSTVAFFYCKYGDEQRNSFTSVSRSILAQTLNQHSHLLPYFHGKVSTDSKAILTSLQLAKEMMDTSLRNCETTYIVIDGVDECGRAARKEITNWFRKIVHEPTTEKSSIRCLFVSQDDGIAVEDFRGVPEIKVKSKNRPDIEYFAGVWHQKIEDKFGSVFQSKNSNIRKIISARAQGKLARYMEPS
jgi:hypothetical protein